MPWIIGLNLCDYSISSIVGLGLFVLLVCLFNLGRLLSAWKITSLLYIVGVLMGASWCLDGYNVPY